MLDREVKMSSEDSLQIIDLAINSGLISLQVLENLGFDILLALGTFELFEEGSVALDLSGNVIRDEGKVERILETNLRANGVEGWVREFETVGEEVVVGGIIEGRLLDKLVEVLE